MKDAETLIKLGFVATTNAEGATPLKAKISKWVPELNKWFHGVKQVFIHADNDEPGRKFAREKLQALRGIVPDIRIVWYPDVPEGQDVTYWLETLGHTREEFIERCKAAPLVGSKGTIERVLGSDVEISAIEWLWDKRFAVGKIGVIAGLPDGGKGQVLNYIAARITRALAWPMAEGCSRLGNVIILSAEEDLKDSLAPRLIAAGADMKRVSMLQMVYEPGDDGQERKRMFSIVSDLEILRQQIDDVGNVIAVLIDPISSYLGLDEVDSYRETDVRAALGPLKDLAEEKRIAIITIMHFNKKVDVTNAMLRISSSLAFVGLPRHVYAVISDTDNDRQLFVRAKNNDAPISDNQTLAFTFKTKEVGYDEKLNKVIVAPYIEWETEYVDITANEAMQAASENKSPGARDKAKKLLQEVLKDGPKPVKGDDGLEDLAKGHDISWPTMERAKKDLGIIAEKDSGPKGAWRWRLPLQNEVTERRGTTH